MSLGFWIGAGSRDERDDRAGVSHFIEHLLFKGSRSYDAQQIAETFDAMGAELNAATSREHTVVYSRVPDRHIEDALEVMTDMVFAPAFAELDQEREVVLEEIAMYEDTPQELVHDLFSEAVFGAPCARAARDRDGGGDLDASAAARSPRITARCTRAGTSSSPPPGTSRTTGSCRCSSAPNASSDAGAAERAARAPAAHAGAAAGCALPAQGHGAVPPLPRRARHLALRPAPLRRVAPRRDPRRLGVVAALPGDPREARDGVRGLHVRVAVHGHRPDRDLRRHARGEPRIVRRDLLGADRRDRGGQAPRRASSRARRRASRAGSCCRWSRRRTG